MSRMLCLLVAPVRQKGVAEEEEEGGGPILLYYAIRAVRPLEH
jgi:hypothetical protein